MSTQNSSDTLAKLATRTGPQLVLQSSLLLRVVPDLRATSVSELGNVISRLCGLLCLCRPYENMAPIPGSYFGAQDVFSDVLTGCNDVFHGLKAVLRALEQSTAGVGLKREKTLSQEEKHQLKHALRELGKYELSVELFICEAKVAELEDGCDRSKYSAMRPLKTAIKTLESQLNTYRDKEIPTNHCVQTSPSSPTYTDLRRSKPSAPLASASGSDNPFLRPSHNDWTPPNSDRPQSTFTEDIVRETQPSLQHTPSPKTCFVSGIPKQFRSSDMPLKLPKANASCGIIPTKSDSEPARQPPPATPIRYGSASFIQPSPTPWGKLPKPISVSGPNPFLAYANAHEGSNKARVFLSPAKMQIPKFAERDGTKEQMSCQDPAVGRISTGDEVSAAGDETFADGGTEYHDAEDR
ncbi:hypothetical protein EJ05DRAFT_288176 [Pseudovirgaria hyperparasitica]|uniref:Uncharacterized protein n=1 Tax=Pseudovirgaria hyperparasitica TaxID=470096 RepID=A0A6A6WHA2_9PEZI|nr:uncharacterized protein EJ05DRAFT_288176 [Pseudovirgaria hyperparasitica]KAF2760531.1 hypothetical protein EJ05DRAFT_288176 [Pseudovirgaria hyperparasitica]